MTRLEIGDSVFESFNTNEIKEFAHLNEITLKIIEENIGRTDSKIILTSKQHTHIKEGAHPQDYPYFIKYGKEVLESPDLLLKGQTPNTVLFLKAFEDTRINVVVKVSLLTEEGKNNSIITAHRVGLDETSRSFRKLIKRNPIIYKFENMD